MTDAKQLLASLVGHELQTVTGKPNRVLRLEGDSVIVGSTRSPGGQPVPLVWIQDALDRLESDGEVAISVDSVGHRSAFVGAVLLKAPGAELIAGTSPPRVRLVGAD